MLGMLWLVLAGAVFGIANVIPGVSGGTLAVVMNVYDGLIDSIANFRKHWKQSLRFLFPFLVGAGAAILLFSKLVKFLLDEYPMQVNFFFIGLIIGSIPMIAGKALKGTKVHFGHIVGLLVGLGLMVGMFFLSPNETAAVETQLTVPLFFTLLLSGIIAAVTMIIPGISGSLMLLVLGMYNTVIAAVSDLGNFNNILILLPFGFGVLIGFFAGTKLISVCLSKAPKVTYCLILGLVVGSLLPVFAESGFVFSTGGLIACGFLLIGAALAFFMGREKKEKVLEADA